MNAPVPGLAPTTYIGQDTLRPNARRLLAGRGQYVDLQSAIPRCWRALGSADVRIVRPPGICTMVLGRSRIAALI